MVKRPPVLEGIEAEAGVRYEDTRLARQATIARRRLAWLLIAGAAALAVEALLQRDPLWLLGTAFVALTAWAVHRGRLGGVAAAGLVALVATLAPLGLLAALRPHAPPLLVAAAVSVALGVAMLPSVLVLVRDQELQHAYGLWARRDA